MGDVDARVLDPQSSSRVPVPRLARPVACPFSLPSPWAMGPMAPSQIRTAPLKRVTDGIEKSDGTSLDSAAVFLISWQRPASAISPRACFDLTGACSHVCTLAASSRQSTSGTPGFFIPLARPAWRNLKSRGWAAKLGCMREKVCFCSALTRVCSGKKQKGRLRFPGPPTGLTDQAIRPVLGA